MVGQASRVDVQPEYSISADGTAIVAMHGLIVKRPGLARAVKGTSVETLIESVRTALADERVERVVIDVDSPGGTVDGVEEGAHALHEMVQGSEKPVTAQTDGDMASAAYWLASQANSVSATKGARVGSIGVFAAVIDRSEQLKQDGITLHVVSSTPEKGDLHPGQPVTEKALARLQEEINDLGGRFVADVERGRGERASASTEWANGRMMSSQQAVDLGLIDEVLGSGPHYATGTTATEVAACKVSAMTTPTETAGTTAPQPAAAAPEPANTTAPPVSAVAQPDAGAIEHERAKQIMANASPSQFELAQELIEKRTPVNQALSRLLEDERTTKSDRLASASKDRQALGDPPVDDEADDDSDYVETDPKAQETIWRKEFGKSRSLQAEFGSFDRFAAYKRHSDHIVEGGIPESHKNFRGGE